MGKEIDILGCLVNCAVGGEGCCVSCPYPLDEDCRSMLMRDAANELDRLQKELGKTSSAAAAAPSPCAEKAKERAPASVQSELDSMLEEARDNTLSLLDCATLLREKTDENRRLRARVSALEKAAVKLIDVYRDPMWRQIVPEEVRDAEEARRVIAEVRDEEVRTW